MIACLLAIDCVMRFFLSVRVLLLLLVALLEHAQKETESDSTGYGFASESLLLSA